jgi:hypothetical protein
MAGRITAYVFIDANTALHFKRPDQIDWQRLTNAGEVSLVAAPILLRELESQKIVNASRKLRERATEYIKWLHPFVLNPAIEVRSGVRWVFLPHEPQIDFTAERLSLGIADDHLIGSVLDYTPAPDGPVFVATADIGLHVKLRARVINVLVLPEEARLPAEPDPLERENRSLRQEIGLQSRMPKLSVTFESGAQHYEIYLGNPPDTDVPSLAQIKAEHAFVVRPGGTPPPGDGTFALADLRCHLEQLGISGERADDYNDELTEYYAKYERYLADLEAWREEVRLHAILGLVLANNGTAPASNIDLELNFPGGVAPVDHFPKQPKPPKPPRKPQGLLSFPSVTSSDYLSSLIRSPDLSAIVNPNYDGVPVIDRDTSSVCISFSSLKHGFTRKCDLFLSRFQDQQSVSAFSIGYRLSADELPDAIAGELHVHVRIDDGEG